MAFDTPNNLRTDWPTIIDEGEIFNGFIAQNNLIIHSLYSGDNSSTVQEIVSHDKIIYE